MLLGTPDRIAARSATPPSPASTPRRRWSSATKAARRRYSPAPFAPSSPTRASIVGTDARIEIEGDFYAPAAVTLIPRAGEPIRVASAHAGRGLRHQADEVARCLAAGELESPLMALDETISIMQTMDTVLDQAQAQDES